MKIKMRERENANDTKETILYKNFIIVVTIERRERKLKMLKKKRKRERTT